jgi:hypothetical protein
VEGGEGELTVPAELQRTPVASYVCVLSCWGTDDAMRKLCDMVGCRGGAGCRGWLGSRGARVVPSSCTPKRPHA